MYVYSLSPPRRFGLPDYNFQGVMGVTVGGGGGGGDGGYCGLLWVTVGWFTASLVKIRVKLCT